MEGGMEKKLQQQFTLSVTPKKRNWNNKGKSKKKQFFCFATK